jgi:hypothetical protein
MPMVDTYRYILSVDTSDIHVKESSRRLCPITFSDAHFGASRQLLEPVQSGSRGREGTPEKCNPASGDKETVDNGY